MLENNIFLKIIDKSLRADILYEDEHCIAFSDVNPQAPIHVLIIPRKVIRSHRDILPDDLNLIGHLNYVATLLARQLNLVDGYRLVVNCESAGGQTVPHLHLHLLGGRPMSWPPG